MSRIFTLAIGGALALETLFVGSGTVGGQSPGGPIKVWGVVGVTSSNKPSPVLLTGAVADHGTTQTVNSSGQPDENGNTVKVTLKKGTFKVDITQLNTVFDAAQPSDFNTTNCSGSITAGPAPVPIESGTGTGAYVGISGSLQMNLHMALILPKSKRGTCNTASNAMPVAGWGVITGTGAVGFG